MLQISPDTLHGQRVLLLIIPLDDPRRTLAVVGDATWTGPDLQLRHSETEPAVVVSGREAATNGFDPDMLPRLVLPAALRQLEPLATGVVACIPIFSENEPRGAVLLDRAFYGLAGGRDGRVILAQGTPDFGISGVDDCGNGPEPWAAEPWESDGPTT